MFKGSPRIANSLELVFEITIQSVWMMNIWAIIMSNTQLVLDR